MGKSFLLAGGGTAGHVNPLLATASELMQRGHRVAVLGTVEGLEHDLVPRAGLELLTVPRVPMPRRVSRDLFALPGRLRKAVAAAGIAIEEVGADAVVGFGGYVSAPAYLAARRRKLPMVIHEANARPGLANRLGARFSPHVAITFPGTPLRSGQVTGLPLRPEISDLAALLLDGNGRAEVQSLARLNLRWPADAPVLLVTGGSLGAASLNAAIVKAVPTLVAHGVHVLHLTGAGKAESAMRARANLPTTMREYYRVEEYSHDMAGAFAAAEAVVCRAGAATVCEVSALGLPALYVPLPHGNGEQALNARQAVDAGAATLIHDADLTSAALELAGEQMVLDPRSNAAMSAAAVGVGIRDGSQRLADIIERAVGLDPESQDEGGA